MKLITASVFLAGIGALVSAGFVLMEGTLAYSECRDECHGGALFGLGAVSLAAMGIALVLVGVALLIALDAREGDRARNPSSSSIT